MSVNIAASWKKDTRAYNGLIEIEDELLNQPTERRVVIAEVLPKYAKRDFADGTETPTVQIVHIEPLTGQSAEYARKLLQEAYRERTGNDELPLDYSSGDGTDED